MYKKRSLTLLEIMIVIVLIGLIGSVIGFNMKGSLDEGKAFKTRQAQAQIHDILMLEVARGSTLEDVVQRKVAVLDSSGLVKNAASFLKDGWGEPFEVRIAGRGHDKLVVRSAKLAVYEAKKKEQLGKGGEIAEENDEE